MHHKAQWVWKTLHTSANKVIVFVVHCCIYLLLIISKAVSVMWIQHRTGLLQNGSEVFCVFKDKSSRTKMSSMYSFKWGHTHGVVSTVNTTCFERCTLNKPHTAPSKDFVIQKSYLSLYFLRRVCSSCRRWWRLADSDLFLTPCSHTAAKKWQLWISRRRSFKTFC